MDFPNVITEGQQYNVGEKPTVIMYTYIIAMQVHQKRGEMSTVLVVATYQK